MKKKSQTIKPFNKKEYSKVLKTFGWDELAFDLIKLEIEFEELKNHLDIKQFELFQQLISLYETEKSNRISEQYDHSRRYFSDQTYMTPETELLDEDIENI